MCFPQCAATPLAGEGYEEGREGRGAGGESPLPLSKENRKTWGVPCPCAGSPPEGEGYRWGAREGRGDWRSGQDGCGPSNIRGRNCESSPRSDGSPRGSLCSMVKGGGK